MTTTNCNLCGVCLAPYKKAVLSMPNRSLGPANYDLCRDCWIKLLDMLSKQPWKLTTGSSLDDLETELADVKRARDETIWELVQTKAEHKIELAVAQKEIAALQGKCEMLMTELLRALDEQCDDDA